VNELWIFGLAAKRVPFVVEEKVHEAAAKTSNSETLSDQIVLSNSVTWTSLYARLLLLLLHMVPLSCFCVALSIQFCGKNMSHEIV